MDSGSSSEALRALSPPRGGAVGQVALGTLTFFLTFSAWGLPGACAPALAARGGWSGVQGALFVAVPVLVGALARVPAGMLGDRLGARPVLAGLCVLVAAPVALVPSASGYGAQVALAALVGLAGASFAVGVGFVSRWAPPAHRGTSLGVFGLGNLGQSIALAGAPALTPLVGLETVFRAAALVLVGAGALFAALARDAPRSAPAPSVGEMIGFVRRDGLVWALSATYALTFGGFVALAVYLPTLLTAEHALAPDDAGLRAAGFVLLATAARPLGGWLSDRAGGGRVLALALCGIVPLALLLGAPSMPAFTLGALGCAVLLGVGNGAVFELVPRLYPERAGTVTGVVGAAGGLGGFVPPLLLGALRDELGAVWPGFVLLALAALALAALVRWRLMPLDRTRAAA